MNRHTFLSWLAIVVAAAAMTACQTTASSLPGATEPPEIAEIRVGFSTELDLGDIPILMAHDLLADQGYEVTSANYATADLAVEAVARGDTDIGTGSTNAFWTAVGKEAPIATIMEQLANPWRILTTSDIRTCDDLDGRRFSISGEASVSAAMAAVYIEENCPGVEREIVLIAGSQNRAAALLAGQIDATLVESLDAMQLDAKAPGRFRTLIDFSEALPDLNTTGLHVNRDFAESHPEVVMDYLRALLTVQRQIRDDHDSLVQAAARELEIDPETMARIAEVYFDKDAWDANGGLDEESARYSLQFFIDAGRVSPELTVEDVADLSFLHSVLDEIGRE